MPRRSILSAAERTSLLALPDTEDDLIRHYTYGYRASPSQSELLDLGEQGVYFSYTPILLYSK